MSPTDPRPKILIVDDRPENLQVLLHTLKEDYAVIAATHGAGALALAAKSPLPDLILLDVVMPGMDGYEVCQRLKANPLTQDIPIIFVSALEDVMDETRGFELGAVDYITKPISPPVVRARIKSHLTLRQLNQALSHQSEALAKLSRYKDDFLAHMSHELRAPLNTILAFTEALQTGTHGPLPPHQKDVVHSIHTSSQYLYHLVNDILDLSQATAGKLDLCVNPTAIADLCWASVLFVQQEAQQKNITLTTDLPPPDLLVPMDGVRMKQVLINLLSNGVKFTPPGGTIHLKTGCNPDHLIFTIQDTGIGISPEDQPYLFQPFFQNPQSPTGTGLGLALVKQIVELHGGTVQVASVPGQGSTFQVKLPLEKYAFNPSPEPRSSLAYPRILIIEEDEDYRQTLENYLTARHYAVHSIPTPSPALVARHNPHLILWTINSADPPAQETLRQLCPHPSRPCIALLPPGNECPWIEDLGVTCCLQKPFRLKELTYAIERLLGAK